jgi:hypothetical protein
MSPQPTRRLAPTADIIVLGTGVPPTGRRFKTGTRLAGERRDSFDERRTSDVLREADGVTALAAAPTVPELTLKRPLPPQTGQGPTYSLTPTRLSAPKR